MKKTSLVLCVLLALMLVLSACNQGGTSSSEPTSSAGGESSIAPVSSGEDTTPRELSFTWWTNDKRTKYTLEMVEQFKAKYPYLNVSCEYMGWGDYWDALAPKSASNTLPYVMQQDYAKIGEWIDVGGVIDMNALRDSGDLDLSDIKAESFIGGKIDDKVYAVSTGVNAFCLIYNQKDAEAAGITVPEAYTWDQFLADGKTVFDKTGKTTCTLIATDPKFLFELYIRDAGKTLFGADGKSFGEGVTVQDLEFVYDLQKKIMDGGFSISVDDAAQATDTSTDSYVTGKTWCEGLWSNQVNAVHDEKLKVDADADTEITLWPGTSKGGVYLKPSMMWAITKTCPEDCRPAAAKFISFLLNDTTCAALMQTDRGIPIMKTTSDLVAAVADTASSKVIAYIDVVGKYASPISAPEPVCASQITQAIKDSYDEVRYATKTPADAAAACWAACEQIFKEA